MAATLDARSGVSYAANQAGPITLSHTVGGTANALIVWWACLDGGSRAASGVTYNGVAMTRYAASQADEGLVGCEAWYLANPATGANNVSVTLPEVISRPFIFAASVIGADTAAIIEAANVKESGADVSPTSIDLTGTSADSLVIDCYYMRDATGMAADAGQSNSLVVNGNGYGDQVGISFQVGGAATETATWTTTARGSNGAQSIISVKAGAGGGGGDPEGSLLAGKLLRGGLLLHGVLGR